MALPGTCETARLQLIPVGLEHTNDLVRLHGDPKVAHWYAGPWSPDRARSFANTMRRAWQRHHVGKWMAYGLTDGDLIGRGGLSWARVGEADVLEVGWTLRDRHVGRGYATEIGRAALDFAFSNLGAKEVCAFTERHNHASRAVMERLGMTFRREIVRPGLVPGWQGVQPRAVFVLQVARRQDWGR